MCILRPQISSLNNIMVDWHIYFSPEVLQSQRACLSEEDIPGLGEL